MEARWIVYLGMKMEFQALFAALALAAPIAAATLSAAVRQQDAKPAGENSQESRNLGTTRIRMCERE
jgi:hypothetical protein